MKTEARFAPLGYATKPDMHTETRRVADAALSRWQGIFAAMAPIIGQRGVGALLKRSLYLNQSEHGCLAAVSFAAGEGVALEALHHALLLQADKAAVAAQGALLQTFVDLLGRLIGLPLTEHLIGSAPPPAPTTFAIRNHPT